MSVDTIYDPTPKIVANVSATPEKGGDDVVDDHDDRVPN